ncbi:MAG: sodium:solute symporter family protein [Candidatus Zixiibacteriota bacterium]
MHAIDFALIAVYLVFLLFLGLRGKHQVGNITDLILDGRRLTLPAFTMSLVSTWYGGILGVGEYSYNYGISNWLVFGVPYYVAALLFAFLISKRARTLQLVTIPGRLAEVYNRKTALAGAVIVFMMTVPASYILMMGVLGTQFFNWPLWAGVIFGALFSLLYIYFGAFRSVVITDKIQFSVMFAGFILMFVILVSKFGGWEFLKGHLPDSHFTWHGGNSGWYIATWYFIALQTLIDPAFHQRAYAAKSESVAFKGIFFSILCWMVFDFLSTSCGLYSRAILPDLTNAAESYPALAQEVLPPGLLGLFSVTMLSIIMGTIDSYSFLAASTFGNDIIPRLKKVSEQQIIKLTKLGLFVSAGLSIVWALFFQSAVDIWYAFGSIGTPALLIPLVSTFAGKRRIPARWAFISIILSGMTSLVWFISKSFSADSKFWLGIEPIFSGLLVSLLIYLIFAKPIQVENLQQSRS